MTLPLFLWVLAALIVALIVGDLAASTASDRCGSDRGTIG
jgi:hypothetical protein